MRFAYTLDDPIAATAPFVERRLSRFFPGSTPLERAVPGIPVVELSARCPLLDETLLADMVAAATSTGQTYVAVDAIPGSEPIRVGLRPASPARPFFSRMQNLYCTNFNIGRPNRRKIFNELSKKFDDLPERPILEILDFLQSEDGVDFVVAYGEPVALQRYDRCPCCGDGAPSPQKLYSGTSHPITGFLTKNASIYSHCLKCGLTFLNRQMPREELWRYYQGHSYANAPDEAAIEELLGNLSEANVSHYANYVAVKEHLVDKSSIGDMGAGRGEFAVLAKRWAPSAEVTAFEWRFDDVVSRALSRRSIKPVDGDIQATVPAAGKKFDVLCAWEVIEHLKFEDFRSFLTMVRTSLAPGGLFIFSTPDFDNPYTKALDFWAMAPGEHISVFSRRFLEPILKEGGFEILDEKHESVTLKRPNDWFAFGENTDVHFSSKGASAIIDDFLEDATARERLRQNARDNNRGSELILICRALQDFRS